MSNLEILVSVCTHLRLCSCLETTLRQPLNVSHSARVRHKLRVHTDVQVYRCRIFIFAVCHDANQPIVANRFHVHFCEENSLHCNHVCIINCGMFIHYPRLSLFPQYDFEKMSQTQSPHGNFFFLY